VAGVSPILFCVKGGTLLLKRLSLRSDRGMHFTPPHIIYAFETAFLRNADCTILGLHREMEHVSAILLLCRSRVVSADREPHYLRITGVMLGSDASRHTDLITCFTDLKIRDLLEPTTQRVGVGVGTFLTRRPAAILLSSWITHVWTTAVTSTPPPQLVK
jgi:hypothetical protein